MENHTYANFVSEIRASRRAIVSLALLLLPATGCGVAGQEVSEDIDSVHTELSGCGSVEADVVRQGSIMPAQVSPQSYNKCDKGYVVDVMDLEAAYTGHGNAADAQIIVQWADATITTQAACEGSKVVGLFYQFGSGANEVASSAGGTGSGSVPGWLNVASMGGFGTWTTSGLARRCSFGVSYQHLDPGESYRIAAQALAPNGQTRKLSIRTLKPINQ